MKFTDKLKQKVEKIEYEITTYGVEYLTPCSFFNKICIGSVECVKCKGYITGRNNDFERWVQCAFASGDET